MCLAVVSPAQNRRTSAEPMVRRGTVFIDPVDVPGSLQELIAVSPVILIGTCERVLSVRHSVPGNPESDVVTDKTVRVDAALRGDAQGEVLVEEVGGAGGPLYPQLRAIKKSGRYLLFLQPRPIPVGDTLDRQAYQIAGIWAGSVQLVAGRARFSNSAQPGLRSLNGIAESDLLDRIRRALANTQP